MAYKILCILYSLLKNPAHILEIVHELHEEKLPLHQVSDDYISEHFTYNLKIRNADIEALIHIGVPHNPDIGNKKGSKITLEDTDPRLTRGREPLLQTKLT